MLLGLKTKYKVHTFVFRCVSISSIKCVSYSLSQSVGCNHARYQIRENKIKGKQNKGKPNNIKPFKGETNKGKTKISRKPNMSV